MPRKTKEQKELENEKITSTKQNKEAKSNSKISANKKDLEPKKQKATSKSTAATKSATKKVAKTKKRTTSTSKSSQTKAKKAISPKMPTTKSPKIAVVEYYDLPYRYNQTIVKVLAQTPNTLFVYWDIADSDRENYIKQYGENFFNITRPVLIIHNDTMNYSFEVPINDFANSWYLHINDSKCDYRVELGRRPNYYNEEVTKEIEANIPTDYIYVSTSNEIESPNDHVLFNTNENNTIRVRNVKNYNEKSISLYEIIKHLPAMKKVQNIPYISENLLKGIYSEIYHTKDMSVFDKVKNNPSSGGNPSSGSMSSRFI